MAITIGLEAVGYGAGTSYIWLSSYNVGDLLVLLMPGRDATPALPDGWTNIGTINNSTNIYNRTCYRLVTGDEPAYYEITGTYTAPIMFKITGHDTTDPIAVVATGTSSGTSFSAPGVTTPVDNCMVIHSVAFIDSYTDYEDANYTSLANANLTSLGVEHDYYYYAAAGKNAGAYFTKGIKATAGATGNTTATADDAGNYSATVTFAVQPPYVEPPLEGGSDSTVTVSSQGAGAQIKFGAIYAGAGAIVGGASTINVTVPSGYVAGDLLVLVISGRNSLPDLPAGWTNIATNNNGTNIYNRTCYKFAAASEATLTVADSGTYTVGQMFLFCNVDPANPINISGTNTDSGTTFVANGVTTTADNCLIVHATTFQDATGAADTSNYGTPSNASLTELLERADNCAYTSAGLDGGIYLVTGFRAVAGGTGNTSSTADSANNYSAVVTFALTPATDNLRVVYVTKGAQAGGTGDISVAVPAGYSLGDLLVLTLSGRSAVPDLPAGWVNIDSHNNSTYTFTRSCYKIATASESAVKVTDSGVYTTGLMMLFKGVDRASPINISTKGTDTGTTFVAPGVTTTVNKCMVVHAVSFTDATSAADTSNYGSQSNANLAGLVERNDSTLYVSSGVEGGIYVLTGTKLVAGATGNTSATADSASNYSAIVTFAIQPPYVMPYAERGASQDVVITPQGSGVSICIGSSDSSIIITSQGAGVRLCSGSSESQIIISTQAVGAKTGQGSSSASVFVSTYGSGAIARQGDSSSTTTIAGQGYGVKTTGGARDSPIAILVQGGGEKTLKGSSDVTVLLCVNGSGIKITNGFSNTPNIVSVDGLGIKIGFGSSDSIVAICADGNGVVIGGGVGGSEVLVATSSEGDGEKLVTGANEVIVPTSPDGSGTKVSMVSSESIIDISSDANGIKKSGGGEEASVATSVQFGGTKSISFGENSEIVVYIRGDGYRLYSGGSEIFVDISSDGRGFAIRHGGMEPIIFVTPTVDGYGILKTGSSDSIAVTNPCGFGSKSTVGSSDSTVVIGSFGSDYAPVIMIAVFSPNARLTATFNPISAMDAAFNWTADHTAFFRSRQELSAVFVPTIVIGENYGRS